MGNGDSKESSSEGNKGSRRARFKERLHLGRHFHRDRHRRNGNGSSGSSSSALKHISADNFAGIAILTLIKAETQFKDKWIACLSLGEQAFRTKTSDQLSPGKASWEKKLLLEKNGPHVARISVFETNRLRSNTLVGYCEIDLLEFLTQDSDSDTEVFDLLDPSTPGKVVGNISISCSVEDPIETEKGFVRRILSTVDYNGDGVLSFSEFSDLIDAFGNDRASIKKEEIFKAADKNGDGMVSMDELADLLAFQQEKETLLNCCPVCGEVLQVADKLNTIVHLTLCFDEGTGNQVMTGGFLTDKQASYGWLFKMSEWAHFSSYDVGIRSGSSASHILVYDRKTKRLVEELIDKKIVLSMRAIYQSKVGLGLINVGVKEILQNISESQGNKMNLPESAADIPKFIELFKDQINMAEVKDPLNKFKVQILKKTAKANYFWICDGLNFCGQTFNEFFIRELKPGSRPIDSIERDVVAVCAADCRLMAFKSVDDSLRFWIKGRKFSVQGLLGKEISSSAFVDGTIVIFRLAPQDYHRFHLPVSGKIEQFVDIPGCLYTVNPIAVNSKYCNVFTENKRVVSIISTVDFGKVAFVAIGATMVGSITFTKKKGENVKKGDEFGYFSFGGSTVICVFEKNSIVIDEDLLANSARSLETLVSVGMRLGVSTRRSPVT